MHRSRLITAVLLIALALVGIFFWYTRHQPTVTLPLGVTTESLPSYTKDTLARYNGTTADLPIYIALDGYIYDVTAGREFYVPGGAYHSIAGKDASQELHIFGGDIIRQKYPIVGIFLAE